MTQDLEAIRKIIRLRDDLVSQGSTIPDAYKGRDPKEPGREEKELAEMKLEKLVKRLFAGQKKRIREWLEMRYFERKAETPDEPPEDVFDDPVVLALIIALFIQAVNGGIDITNAGVDDIIDVAVIQPLVIDWVNVYGEKWLMDLNATTREVLQSALEMFKTTPGFTIKDVMDLLPFEDYRKQRIAVTEITRMYGKGQQLAGERLAKDHPGVRVIKTWHTNADDRVCKICKPLNGISVRIMDMFMDEFGEAHLYPPAHVNCRCWMSVRTDILKSVELQK